jgi:hypothetical protein
MDNNASRKRRVACDVISCVSELVHIFILGILAQSEVSTAKSCESPVKVPRESHSKSKS